MRRLLLSILRRFKCLLAVGLSMALVLWCLDGVLARVFGEHLGWAAPAMSSDLLNDWGRRIARVERMQIDGEITASSLVAVLGMSTVREGLDASLLARHDPQHRRWLILGAAGGDMSQLQQYSFTLSVSHLSPSTVVLGIHKSMLQDEEQTTRQAELREVRDSLLGGRVIHAIRRAPFLTWFGRHHDEVTNWAFMAVHHARLTLNQQQRLQLDAIYRRMDNPWTVNSSYIGQRAAADDLAIQLKGLQSELGPERSSPMNAQVKALGEVVHRFRQRGSRVVCVLMPESSEYRSLYSPPIDAMFAQALRFSAQGEAIPVIDLRNALEDTFFYDYAHLNADGRGRLSAILPQRID
jgi:hypothetical protein